MEGSKGVESLFRYAQDHKFEDFDSLLCQMEAKRPLDSLWEAYLMRAQIKLHTADLTLLADLERGERGGASPQFPPLLTAWRSDGVNHFTTFPQAPGALRAFLSTLPRVREKLSRWYGEGCDAVLSQLQSEILYFMGDVPAALQRLSARSGAASGRHTDTILARILEYRCHLALMQPEKAQQCMFDIIRHSKAYPECVKIYEEFRRWANLTTSWSGDSPRVYEDEHGNKRPVLADRLEGIRLGLAQDTPLEAPFLAYAKKGDPGAYSLRQYYMDWFHAMYWLSMGDCRQAETYFEKISGIAAASGVCMPIVECGIQGMPILAHMMKKCEGSFLGELMRRAEEYEEALNAYRLADM